ARDVFPGADEELFRRHDAFAAGAANDHLGVERHRGGRQIRRTDGNAPARAEEAMLAVLALRRIRVARNAARAVAAHAVPVVPATRVLAQIPPERAGIADLWARDAARGSRE